MVKGYERKAYQPSSSAKAAQLLASTAPAPGGFGFGGFSGATPVGDIAVSAADSQASGSTADGPVLTGELDSDISQLLKSLSKKDTITKIKALQKLKVAVASKEPSTIAACLPAWGYIYNKLVMDNSRATRTEASAVLGAMAKVVGKGLAPFLKLLAGSWWLAQFDLHAEAAAAARDAFQIAFHGPKQKEALLFTRTEVLQLLHDDLSANPEGLGDARKETPEELSERHERVLAGSLLAFSSLLDLLVSVQPHESSNERDAQSEVVVQLESLLSMQGFLKRMLAFKSEHVRTAAYTLVAHICYSLLARMLSNFGLRAPQLLAKHMQTAAPLVLGAFQEEQAAAHSAMWEMVLAFAKAHPSAWHALDMRKAVLPRLLTFLRQGCYGSGASSYPAVLPLLHSLPKGLLGPDSKVLNDILAALWSGLLSQMKAGKARDAGGDAFSECLAWALSQAVKLADGGEAAQQFAVTVLQACFCAQVVPAALQGKSSIAATAAAAITKIVVQTSTSSAPNWLADQVLQQLSTATVDILTPLLSNPTPHSVTPTSVSPFTRVGSLLDSLQPAADQQLLLQHVARPIATALIGPVQQGNAPAEASSLLARVIKQFGAEVVAHGATAGLPTGDQAAGGTELRGLSLDSILQSSLSAPLEGPAAQASADLLLSCIHGKPDPAVQLATILQQLVEMPSDYTADATANIASAVSEITGKADAGDNAEATEQQADAAPHPGQVLALLLVQQLLSSLQQASQVLQWQCDELDALACQLVDMHSRSSPEVSRKYSQAGAQQQTGSDASGLAAVAENVASAALSGDAASSGNEAGQIKPSSGHQEPHMPQTAPGGGSMLGDMEEWHKQLQKKLELERQPAHLELPTFDDTGYPSAQLLGLLIKGKGTTSLLSDAVVQKILSQLQEALRQSGAGTVQAFVTLDGCLYSQAVSATQSVHLLQHQIIALTFQLSWPAVRVIQSAKSYAVLAAEYIEVRKPDNDDLQSEPAPAEESDSDDDEIYLRSGLRPKFTISARAQPKLTATEEQASKRAFVLWQGGKNAAQLFADAPAEEQAALQATLVQRLLSFLQDACKPEAKRGKHVYCDPEDHAVKRQYGYEWWKHWAVLAQEVLTAIGQANEPGILLNSLLTSNSGVSVPARAHADAGLCFVYGYDAVLFEEGNPRVSVACDMLIGSGGASEPLFTLRSYLCQLVCRNGRVQHSHVLDDAMPRLLLQVLQFLTQHLSPSHQGNPTGVPADSKPDLGQSICLALVHLLRQFEREATFPGKLETISQWFRTSIAIEDSRIPSQYLSQLMNVTTKMLRNSQSFVSSSGLEQLSVRLCHQANRLPPIAAIEASNEQQLLECADILTNISDAFLLSDEFGRRQPEDGDFLGASTPAERKALLAVAIKQVQGEVSAARAAAAWTRVGKGRQAPLVDRNDLVSRAYVGRVALCAVIYCHKELSEQDWRLLLERAQAVVSSHTVHFEDTTEAMAAAVARVMKENFHSTSGPSLDSMDLKTAVQLLLHAASHTDRALKKQLQAALYEPLADVSEQYAVERARGGDSWHWSGRSNHMRTDAAASSQVLEFLLTQQNENQKKFIEDVPPSLAQDLIRKSYADVLRIIYALGVQEVVTTAAGTYTRHQHDDYQQSLEQIAKTAAMDQSSDAVSSSAQGADDWSSETGVDAATSLLQLALHRQSDMRQAAMALLMTPCLLPTITTASAVAEAEDEQDAPKKAASNVRMALIQAGVRPGMAAILCKAPSVGGESYEDLQAMKQYLWAWAALLAHILALPLNQPGKAFLAQALRAEYELVPDLLNTLLQFLPLKAKAKGKSSKAQSDKTPGGLSQAKAAKSKIEQEAGQWSLAHEMQHNLTHGVSQYEDYYEGQKAMQALASAIFRAALRALPASARAWFGDLRDRGLAASVKAYTAEKESPSLLQQEFQRVQAAPTAPDMDNFSLKANAITREVVAVMEIEDGAVLEMVIKLPASSPLKRAEVSCRRRVGVTEGKLRKWLLSVTAFLANQNGSIAEAITLWQRNVQKEFEGVEECLICYSIVSASDGKLPRLQCKTCSKKFHGSCLYKWFQSSGKSNCPHCQSPW